ncbi:hypothetical protein BpHYR1_046525 [Brachionus plicatilis]|uniref:Uncharacterized protein n=1 Tax=Brachionus plicatilis TaxID=10195 RepID=A0A3M7QU25_BRAPC|nr:hypothetical protein BpHYR1_046525 [Brachionus plicatilis]
MVMELNELKKLKLSVSQTDELEMGDIKAHFKSTSKLIQEESTTLTEPINLKLDGSGCDEF